MASSQGMLSVVEREMLMVWSSTVVKRDQSGTMRKGTTTHNLRVDCKTNTERNQSGRSQLLFGSFLD